ncbi:G protein-activated inward rectifier potassium channel 4-like [Epargyreus clarus]|uniref:G protein-activated inward rectifier potassium channel 4-like n=1 Tax=Epargyreus clarus TaxID=520877 RepID=UPI003C2E982C
MSPGEIFEINGVLSKKCCRYKRHIRQRKSIRRHEERVVFKTGEFNIEKSNTIKYHELPDLVNTFTEARWRWTLLYCVIAYVSNWLIFAIIWWTILYLHGDLEIEHLPRENVSTEWKPCVREIYSFTSVFLFSIEVHTTIGYGKRAITLECPSAMLTMCIESITGKIIQALIIGIVFAKLTRPKNRAQTIMFSKNAIVNQREANLCLIFRVGNTRKARIIGTTVSAYLIKYQTEDGDMLNYDQLELKLNINSSDGLFAFPISAVHVINKTSLFYNMSANDMLKSNLEILVVFEGIIESTGQLVQAKSSYANYDILWGRRFIDPIYYRKQKQGFAIDYIKFDETHRINTPLCTARELHKYYENRNQTKVINYVY